MTPLRRTLAACGLAALPALALAQSAPLKPDGSLRYALGGGGSYLSQTTATTASANIGGEGAFATIDSRWRFGGKALWTRTAAGESAAEHVSVMLSAESQQRWHGATWFRQKLSLFPALRAGTSTRGVVDTGVALAMTPLCSLSLGMRQRYEGAGGLRLSDTLLSTAIALQLR